MPETIEGTYECYKYEGKAQNSWHFVTITKTDNGYLWSNLAGVKWELTNTNKKYTLNVSKNCPYYKNKHTQMSFKTEQNMVIGLYGPWNEYYQKVRKFSDNYWNMNEAKKIKNNNNNNNNDKVNDDDDNYDVPSDNEYGDVKSADDEIDETHDTEGCGKGTDNNDNNKVANNIEKQEVYESLMWKGGKVKKAQKVGRVSIMDNFKLEFNMVIHGKVCDTWENILHIGNENKERSPAVWLHPKSFRLHVRMGMFDDWNKGFDPQKALEKNRKYKIKFQIIDGIASLFIDNKLKTSIGDVTHVTRFRAPVWIGDPWHAAANVTVSNLKIISYI